VRQEDCELDNSLGYVARTFLKKEKGGEVEGRRKETILTQNLSESRKDHFPTHF
jgi:hypothetical protein